MVDVAAGSIWWSVNHLRSEVISIFPKCLGVATLAGPSLTRTFRIWSNMIDGAIVDT